MKSLLQALGWRTRVMLMPAMPAIHGLVCPAGPGFSWSLPSAVPARTSNCLQPLPVTVEQFVLR